MGVGVGSRLGMAYKGFVLSGVLSGLCAITVQDLAGLVLGTPHAAPCRGGDVKGCSRFCDGPGEASAP